LASHQHIYSQAITSKCVYALEFFVLHLQNCMMTGRPAHCGDLASAPTHALLETVTKEAAELYANQCIQIPHLPG
jgi:hypothetical protein